MKLLDTVKSKIDSTVKFIFMLEDGLIMEMAYIDNNTGKDIICVSAQSACSMGCKLCHTTDYIGKLKVRNITSTEITSGIRWVCNELNLHQNKRMLLISYMGCGEPLLNVYGVVGSMIQIMQMFERVRFALATMVPKSNWIDFFIMTRLIKLHSIPVKIHLSLHSSIPKVREELVPRALGIRASLDALIFYKDLTGNAVEIHYALIKGVNDRDDDMLSLVRILKDNPISIKFLPFNTKDSLDWEKGDFGIVESHKELFINTGINFEFYTPPGRDCGSSCGQFLFDYYLKYNTVHK